MAYSIAASTVANWVTRRTARERNIATALVSVDLSQVLERLTEGDDTSEIQEPEEVRTPTGQNLWVARRGPCPAGQRIEQWRAFT
jgi:hypothetical protein